MHFVLFILDTSAVNWGLDGMRTSYEPRSGGRVSVFAEVETPEGLVGVVSSHFEPFVECKKRFRQWKEVLHFLEQTYSTTAASALPVGFILGGDFNTMITLLGRLNGMLPRNERLQHMARALPPLVLIRGTVPEEAHKQGTPRNVQAATSPRCTHNHCRSILCACTHSRLDSDIVPWTLP